MTPQTPVVAQFFAAQSRRVLEPLDALIAKVNALIAESSEPQQGRRAIRDVQS